MKTTSSEKIKIGIFTIVGLLLLALGVFFIGKQKNMFGSTFSVYGNFRSVGGLQTGNNVRFAGINVGTIQNIAIMNDTTVRVDMRVKSNVQQFIRTNAVASIGSDGLMGDKLITISPGTPNAPTIKDGGRVQTVNPTDFDAIINKISSVADNADDITSDLADITSQISEGKGSIGRLLYSDSLERTLETTAQSAHQTVKTIKKGAEGFSQNMQALKHNFLLRGYFKKKKREKREEKKKQKEQQEENSGK